MKISVDGKDLFELTDTQKRVIMNDIPSDIFYEDMCRRLRWILEHKHERCMKRLRDEWTPKLAAKMDSIPSADDKFAELVFAQPEYQDRQSRETASQ